MNESSKTDKKILVELYLASLGGAARNPFNLSDRLGIDKDDMKDRLNSLRSRGLVNFSKKYGYFLTHKGREGITVVMAGGAFDIIHPGHLETLEKSKALGDVLVVSVARDVTFKKNKHKTPLHNEELRRKLVLAMKPVDDAVLGSKTDIFQTVQLLKPNIIALGYDQAHSDAEITEEARKRGIQVKVVRLDSSMPSIKTAKIIEKGKGSLREI
ncbi:MAG: adenylyltransferase/cytidyltransferase family protein [Nitrososphaerales archaeon]